MTTDLLDRAPGTRTVPLRVDVTTAGAAAICAVVTWFFVAELPGVDLVVRSGEVHDVIGPNGSGKSTLSHVIMGRPGYEVLGGSVTLDGEYGRDIPTWQRSQPGLKRAMQYTTEVHAD